VLMFTSFIIVVTQKLVLRQSKNVTAKCTETLSPPPFQFSSSPTIYTCISDPYWRGGGFLQINKVLLRIDIILTDHTMAINQW